MTESNTTKLSLSLDDIDALLQLAARSPLSQAELLFVQQKAGQLQADRQRMAVARWQERQGAETPAAAEESSTAETKPAPAVNGADMLRSERQTQDAPAPE